MDRYGMLSQQQGLVDEAALVTCDLNVLYHPSEGCADA